MERASQGARSSLLCDDRPKQNLTLSFLLPCAIVAILFALNDVIPALGGRMLLAHDEWHQYYPFLLDFRRKLLDGSSLAYSWTSGMGTNFAPLYAYYLASPMYLLSVLVPEAYMADFLAILTYLKIGLAGLFFAGFLRLTFRKCDFSCVAFSVLYALCAFISGYYWNVIWLDTVALLPLVAAGTVSLLRDGKFVRYTLALFFAVWCNYYISFFVCIFVALLTLCYFICCWKGWKNLLIRLGGMALCTAIALGMTAVLVIPTYLSLANTASAVNRFPEGFAINLAGADKQNWGGVLLAMRMTLTGLLTDTTPTTMTGNPNIFCGLVSTFLACMFVLDGKIKLRERICCILLLLFFCASFIFRQLDYIWHGFHFPNMLPHRFSFLFSFVMVYMGWRAYQHLHRYKLWQVLTAAGLVLALFASSYSSIGMRQLLVCIAVCLCVGVLYLLRRYLRLRSVAAVLLAVVCVGEATLCLARGVEQNGLTTKSGYPKRGAEVSALLKTVEQAEQDNIDLYRTEVSSYQTLNDPALLGYNGVTIFSSSTNVAASNLTENLGLASWPGSNRYAYYESTPFTNLLIGLKYIINRTGGELNPTYTQTVKTQGEVTLARNTAYLPMGFLMNAEVSGYRTVKSKRPIAAQQELFTLATGIEDDLYTPLGEPTYLAPQGCTLSPINTTEKAAQKYRFSTEDASGESTFSFTYTVDRPALFCLYLKGTNTTGMEAYRNGERIQSAASKVGCLYCLGEYKAGESLEIRIKAKQDKTGTIDLEATAFEQEVFDRGYRLLAQSTLKADKVSDTELCGSIQADRDGVFYTSIPYEKGWQATVDGRPVSLTPLGDGFVAFPMEQGIHRVQISYHTPGFDLGLAISVCSLVAFVLLLVLAAIYRRRKKAAWDTPAAAVCRESWQLGATPEAADETDEFSDETDGLPDKTDAFFDDAERSDALSEKALTARDSTDNCASIEDGAAPKVCTPLEESAQEDESRS